MAAILMLSFASGLPLNLTGSTFFFSELNAKRIELLKEALPRIKRVAVLVNGANPSNLVTFDAMARTARSVGIEAVQILAGSPDQFHAAFAQIMKGRSEAVSVYEDPLFVAQAAELAALAQRHRLPSVGFREYAFSGGLLAFGVDFPHVWKRAASFVDRIFRGAKPSELPMEQAGKFETVVNLRTARALQLATLWTPTGAASTKSRPAVGQLRAERGKIMASTSRQLRRRPKRSWNSV